MIYFLREFFEVVAMEDAKAAADGILDSLRQLVLLGLTSCDRGCWPNHCSQVVYTRKHWNRNEHLQFKWHLWLFGMLYTFTIHSIPYRSTYRYINKYDSTRFEHDFWPNSHDTVDGRNLAPFGMVKKPINNGIIIILGGAGFCPSTVCFMTSPIHFIASKRNRQGTPWPP